MKNKIQLKISNRGIYTLIASFILILAAVIVHSALAPGVAPNPGHNVSEILGACNSTGGGCDFLSNYYNKTQVYSKAEVDGMIASITNVCTWIGWNPPRDCEGIANCVVPDCELNVGECSCDSNAPGYNPDCCIHYPQSSCQADDFVTGYYCNSTGQISQTATYYTGCNIVPDTENCAQFPA